MEVVRFAGVEDVLSLVIAVPVALLEVIQERSVGLLILQLVREVVTGHVV